MEKPKCKLIGEEGNIFVIIGRASRALKQAGMVKEALEMKNKVFLSSSYEKALAIIQEYVEVE